MSKLIYGKRGQVRFLSEAEKSEALSYILTSPNVVFKYENNQDQGAWAPEKRICFKRRIGVPACLQRMMTAGRGSLYGRINCEELYDELFEDWEKHNDN